jgi:type III secretion system low calcium response chaperone LcrH/SycD
MDYFKIALSVQKKLKNSFLIETELRNGVMAQHILEFSNELMAKGYQVACQFLEKKMHKEAQAAFFFLSVINSSTHEYWLGLGMATQLCHEYEKAIDAYEIAALCDLYSPTPYFYLAKCLFAIHDQEASLEALNLAIEIADEREEYTELIEQAKKAKKLLLLEKGYES